MNVLVTGGAGYIGSHTCIELLEAGHTVTVIDNLSNSSLESLKRVKQITGKDVVFHKVDLLDKPALAKVLESDTFDAAIHFAALKAVGESVEQPITYYHNNVTGTLNLCEAMANVGLKNIVFSSSATVYGTPKSLPLTEDADTPIEEVTNPYGRSKLMVEWALKDIHTSDGDWNIALLRYFNPVGAHKSGLIGEDPQGPPNNLMPYVSQVAVGKREKLSVYGDDYATPDGTGVRDYIHVVDLAKGHVKAIEKLATKPGVVVYNLGTGQGYSVLEMVKGFEAASGKDVPYQIIERRAGDIASCYADPEKAKSDLGWQAELGLRDMCEDSWRWQSQNPDGYKQAS